MLEAASTALRAAQVYLGQARDACLRAVVVEGKVDAARLEAEQRRVHGYAWAATIVASLAQLLAWAERLAAGGGGPDAGERLILRIAFGEYLGQLLGGLPMSQNELVRPADLGCTRAASRLGEDAAVQVFLGAAGAAAARRALSDRLLDGWRPDDRLGDETLDMIREQLRQFVDERIAPHAHGWHRADALIPDGLVAEMAALGVFGMCIDPAHGGLGLGKLAMCVASEELSRGWIAAGSLGTRSEIAGELIGVNGTAAQQAYWLPLIASGKVLPAAVFTEPDTGSDLASVKTRAAREADGSWKITGAKTWITHAARSDLMTVLARSDPRQPGHAGLSIFLAAKTRRNEHDDFPDAGLDGAEIQVLGYRGMKEYILSFDGFAVGSEGLLGATQGAGFRQLMQTFEAARIQTAARAVGVARNALDLAVNYAVERKQFGKRLGAFPRVADKLAMMAVETIAARELTYFAARAKDSGSRCDVEAGMAKLLAARVAWSNADAGVQIHGANGYALDYEISRVLCDARVLSIFEGAAEIQAGVVGRGLLGQARKEGLLF